MAFRYSPRIVNDGLVFNIDAKNKNSIYQTNIKGLEVPGGTNNYVGVDSIDFDKTNADNFSFGGWFYFNTSLPTNQLIFGKWGTNTNSTGSYTIYRDGVDAIKGGLANGSSTIAKTGTHAYSINTWMFLVFTYESGVGMKVYKDDNGFVSSAYTGSINNPDIPLRIGKADYQGSAFDGFADECFFYNKTLTSTQISNLYNEGRGVTYDTIPDLVDLVSWWSLKDNGNDIHGSNNFTTTGVPTFNQSGIRFTTLNTLNKSQEGVATNGALVTDGAWEFDGVNDYIDFGPIELISTTIPFTVEIWCNSTNPTNFPLPLSLKNDGSQNWFLFYANGELRFGSPSVWAEGKYSTTNADLQAFHQWVVTYNGAAPGTLSNFKLYKDGQEVTVGTTSVGTIDDTNTYIGRYSNPTYFYDGQISNAKIYNRSLTQEEITQNYNTLKGRFGL